MRAQFTPRLRPTETTSVPLASRACYTLYFWCQARIREELPLP